MAGTYLSMAVILAAAAAAGQGLFIACGRREWSWLSPAVGLAACAALAWGALSVTDEPAAALVAVVLLGIAGLGLCVVAGEAGRVRPGVAVAVLLGAALLASLPFAVEGRFGILGTSLNPDMSQHLFAADRLATGGEERLIAEGYPLGPHALVVGVAELGPSLVAAFSGLTLAVAVAASLAALELFGRLAPARAIGGALLVGPRLHDLLVPDPGRVQGDHAGALRPCVRDRSPRAGRAGARRRRAGLALAAPDGRAAGHARDRLGLHVQLPGTDVAARRRRDLGARRGGRAPEPRPGSRRARARGRRGRRPARRRRARAGPAGGLRELRDVRSGRRGLGNLFNPISPVEALGIWPSGDFRLDPGAGFAPSAAFWLGGLVGLVALGFGLRWWLGRGERAVPAALAAAAILYLYALVAGTPYQEAKAIAIAAPLAMLVSARALLEATPPLAELRSVAGRAAGGPGAGGRVPGPGRGLQRARAGERAGRADGVDPGSDRATRERRARPGR